MSAKRNANLAILIVTLAIPVAMGVVARGAEPPAASAPLISFPNGVHDIGYTIVIPRQRKIPHGRSNSESGVPAPYQATQRSRPAGLVRGQDKFGTVLRFSPTVTGQLIRTEGYGSGKVGGWWNDDNKAGDTGLQSYLCGSASDLTIDGRAELHNYAYGRSQSAPGPDIHGPDSPHRADGLTTEGSGFCGERLRFFQIPGTAIVLKGGIGTQAGAYGIYDDQPAELSDVFVSQSIGGVDCRISDSRLTRIAIANVTKDGLSISGPGTYVDDCHVWGADRAAVFIATAFASHCYFEAARIGAEITPGAHHTLIDGLNIGPGTCWHRGVKIGAEGCTITNLSGDVKPSSALYPDIVGVEIGSRLVNVSVSGQLSVGNGSVGIVARGHHGRITLRGEWPESNPTLVRVAEPVTGYTIDLTGAGAGGVVLDLSASGLDRMDGEGNEFKVKWGGSAKRVVYPGGGTTYNLAPGTQVWIDGRLQAAPTKAGYGRGTP